MRKKRLVFDQLEDRIAPCSAFGDFVALTASSGGTGLPQTGSANENASEVGGYKSGGYAEIEIGFANVGEAVQFQLKGPGGICSGS